MISRGELKEIKANADGSYTAAEPVSYTHLDVYKRQPLEDVRVYLNSRSPVHTMDLLRERSAALRAQWQELMRIDEAILRKLQFMEEKQEPIFWDCLLYTSSCV